MDAHVSEPRDGLDEDPPGTFLGALVSRRRAVLARLDPLPAGPRLAEIVFDILIELATQPDVKLDANRVYGALADGQISRSEAQLPLEGDGHLGLGEALQGPAPASAVEAINALFALGYQIRLDALSTVERRTFTLRVVGLLPGVERLGPFVLSDFVDLVCEEEDALRFWQIYVDRVALEISKRTQVTAPQAGPWLLSELLVLEGELPTSEAPGAWLSLKRHVNRVLQTRRHRWRFVRSLLEGCHHPRMLHYVCTSPAVAEDVEILYVFLTRGNSKLVSCALFALQVHPVADDAVERALAYLGDRPLPEVADRIVEIYAQAHLPEVPVPALRRLAVGLRERVGGGLHEGSIEALLSAISLDARGFRQVLLCADLSAPGGGRLTPQLRQLLERVLAVFLRTFTPSGVAHPLNDGVFRGAVQRALRGLVGGEVAGVLERLEDFGARLPEHVSRWGGAAEIEPSGAELLAQFLGRYVESLLGAARALYGDLEAQEAGLSLYRLLVRLYLRFLDVAEGTGWFGAMEYVLPALFSDLALSDEARVGEAAQLVAQVERELGLVAEEVVSQAALLFPRRPAAEEDQPPAAGDHNALVRRPRRDAPLRAAVRVLRRGVGWGPSILRAYLGVDALHEWGASLLHLLGVRSTGELRLTDRELLVTTELRFAGQVVRRTGDSHALSDLVAVHVRQRLRTFYLVLGGASLVCAGLLGGHLLFVGLRGAETAMAVVGAGVWALGLLFDAALTQRAEGNRRAAVLELRFRSHPRLFRLLLDTETGAAMLDAFMASNAERREMELLDSWAVRDVSWEPLDEDDDAA